MVSECWCVRQQKVLQYGVGSALKDGVKDKLKGMATLGTVRFNTVQTPKYLVLSGNSLHLFDTDTEGEIDRHLFDAAFPFSYLLDLDICFHTYFYFSI